MDTVTVIMPALNEEKNIEEAINNVLDTFRQLKIKGELIIVNDGSKDKTLVKAQRYLAAFPERIRIIDHSSPQGIGVCFWEGIREARYETVVMIPGDGENDCYEILKYLPLLQYVDMVIPFVINKEVRPFWRNVLSYLFLLVINLSFGVWLNYTNGTVLYKKSVLEKISAQEKGFFYQVEALIKTIKKGYLFAEVPYKLSRRKEGKSKAISFKTFREVTKGYLNLLRNIYFNF